MRNNKEHLNLKEPYQEIIDTQPPMEAPTPTNKSMQNMKEL